MCPRDCKKKLQYYKYTAVQQFGIGTICYVFKRSLLCSSILHLFD